MTLLYNNNIKMLQNNTVIGQKVLFVVSFSRISYQIINLIVYKLIHLLIKSSLYKIRDHICDILD